MSMRIDPERRLHRAMAIAAAGLSGMAFAPFKPTPGTARLFARPPHQRPISQAPLGGRLAHSPSTMISGSGGRAPRRQMSAPLHADGAERPGAKRKRQALVAADVIVGTPIMRHRDGRPRSAEARHQFMQSAAASVAETVPCATEGRGE